MRTIRGRRPTRSQGEDPRLRRGRPPKRGHLSPPWRSGTLRGFHPRRSSASRSPSHCGQRPPCPRDSGGWTYPTANLGLITRERVSGLFPLKVKRASVKPWYTSRFKCPVPQLQTRYTSRFGCTFHLLKSWYTSQFVHRRIQPLGKQQVPRTARKCYRQSGGAQTAPGRTSDPMASSKRRRQHANATGRAAVPRRRQGVHPTPWRAPSAAHSTQMPPAERRCPDDASATPGRTSNPLASAKCRTQHANATGRAAVPRRRQRDARAYIRPLGKQQVPHSTQMQPAERQCPDDASATPGCTSNPLASTKCRTQHANATGRAAVPRRRQRDARAYIQPLGEHQVPHTAPNATGRAAVPRRRQRDARAYIRPLGKQQVPHTAPNATGRAAVPRRRQRDARAYIRPLGKQQVPRTARKCDRQSGGAQTAPGRTSDPFCPAASAADSTLMRTGRAAVPRRRQGDARAYIRPLGKQQGPYSSRPATLARMGWLDPRAKTHSSQGADPIWGWLIWIIMDHGARPW